MADEQGYARLEHQIAWYDRRSASNKRWHYALKIIVIVTGALIPFFSGFLWSDEGSEVGRWGAGVLGVVVVVVEGLQHLFQFQRDWLRYRATAESLKHEKYLFLGNAGDYATAADPMKLLVERTEMHISREHGSWVATHKRGDQREQA